MHTTFIARALIVQLAHARACTYIFFTTSVACAVAPWGGGGGGAKICECPANATAVGLASLGVQPILAIQDGKLCGRHY